MFGNESLEPSGSEMNDKVQQYEDALRNNEKPFFEVTTLEYIVDWYIVNAQYEKAIIAADVAIEQFPFSSLFFTKKAEAHIELKNYLEAIENLDKAEAIDPNNMNNSLLRADIFLAETDFQSAVKMVKKAITQAEKEELDDLYLEMADVYEEWEKLEKVNHYLEKALMVNPKNQEALNRLWFGIEILEDYEHSIDFHTKLIDITPYNHLAWFNLGHAYAGVEKFDKAVEAFEFVIAIDDKFDSAYTDCADLLFMQKKYREAVELYLDALRISKPGKELFFNIAECYEKLDDNNKARYYFKKATNVDPHYAEAFYRIGTNYRNDNRVDNAINSFKRAIKLKENNPSYMKTLADLYQQIDQRADALDIYKKVIEIEPLKKANWINYATALFDDDETEACFAVLDEAENTFKNNADIFYLKCAFYYSLGKKKEALLCLERGLNKKYKDHYLIYEINGNLAHDSDIRNTIEQYKS